MEHKITHFLHIPFTGLGNFQGFRGNVWLKNRIQIFKQFVIPSLQAQTNQDFILWIAWRYKEKTNQQVQELKKWIDKSTNLKAVFTFSGIGFYDDKYPDDIARERLLTAVHGSMGDLINAMGDCDEVFMTIQPSDDCYNSLMVEEIQNILRNKNISSCGYSKGYIINYATKEVREYNPKTNPPFYTIKFPREIFVNPLKHAEYTGIKYNFYNTKYPLGTPLTSHEYLKDVFGDRYAIIDRRGFLVGTHGVNISTHFNIPYAGEKVSQEVLKDFGIYGAEPLKIKVSIYKNILKRLPYKIQRKLRYWNEVIFHDKKLA